ncbi:MAG: ribose transport system permease protein [Planctomycetota bacterium]|jgi:ribose transport system permease protein
MNKILGIFGLLIGICAVTSAINPQFLSAYNLQNIIRWSALFGVLSIGVSFVIITGGIDLSIGSVVGLVGCLVPWLLVEHNWGVGATLAFVFAVSLGIGVLHGLLITKLRLQPFLVTLCGLLFYRGIARYLTDDQTQGFGNGYKGLRTLATGKPFSMGLLMTIVGALALVVTILRRRAARAAEDQGGSRYPLGTPLVCWALVLAFGLAALLFDIPVASEILAPTPFLILLVLGGLASVFLNETVWGRHLFALGRNEQAARYSGINTDRMVILAYVFCALLAGLGGVLFALDVNSIQPAQQGNFYELYAIAAAVLGGCSLRGGEGSILGVVIGAAVMRVLYNSINLLEIPTQLEFAIIGVVILFGVIADELVKRYLANRRRGREFG